MVFNTVCGMNYNQLITIIFTLESLHSKIYIHLKENIDSLQVTCRTHQFGDIRRPKWGTYIIEQRIDTRTYLNQLVGSLRATNPIIRLDFSVQRTLKIHILYESKADFFSNVMEGIQTLICCQVCLKICHCFNTIEQSSIRKMYCNNSLILKLKLRKQTSCNCQYSEHSQTDVSIKLYNLYNKREWFAWNNVLQGEGIEVSYPSQ